MILYRCFHGIFTRRERRLHQHCRREIRRTSVVDLFSKASVWIRDIPLVQMISLPPDAPFSRPYRDEEVLPSTPWRAIHEETLR